MPTTHSYTHTQQQQQQGGGRIIDDVTTRRPLALVNESEANLLRCIDPKGPHTQSRRHVTGVEDKVQGSQELATLWLWLDCSVLARSVCPPPLFSCCQNVATGRVDKMYYSLFLFAPSFCRAPRIGAALCRKRGQVISANKSYSPLVPINALRSVRRRNY